MSDLGEHPGSDRRPTLHLCVPDLDMLLVALRRLKAEGLADGRLGFGGRDISNVMLVIARHRAFLREWYGWGAAQDEFDNYRP